MSKLLEVVRKIQNKDKELWKQKQSKINLDFLKFLQEAFKDGFLKTIDKFNNDTATLTCLIDTKNKTMIQIIAFIMLNFLKQIVKNVTSLLDQDDYVFEPGVPYPTPIETDWPNLVGFMISKRKESTFYATVSEIKNSYVNVKFVLNGDSALLYIESDLESDLESDSYYSNIPITINLND